MTQSTEPKLRDLRQDRAGRHVYIPIARRFGEFVVPTDRAASLDRSVSRFSAITTFVMLLLIGLFHRSPAMMFGMLALGLIALGIGRTWMAAGLEAVSLPSGSLVPRSLSWAEWAARVGKVQLRVGLVVFVASALFPLPALATAAPFTGTWIGALVWSLLSGFFAYASWRGLRLVH